MSEKPLMSTSEMVSIGFASIVVALLVLFNAPDLVAIPIAVFTVGWVGFSIVRSWLKARNEEEGDA